MLLECSEIDLEFSQALWRLSLAASFKTSAVCKSSPAVLIKIWQKNKQRQLEKHLESVVLFMTVVTCYDSEQLQNLIESTEPLLAIVSVRATFCSVMKKDEHDPASQ